MRAVFFGTPEIAVPALIALSELAQVTAVVCQPDRPSGRGLALHPPPVKERALALGLTVVQPSKVRTPDFAAWLASERADVALVMAYGRILPRAVLDAPRRGCMNLHASLLPKFRGAAPITWAIALGESVTGVSLMQMDEGMDTGPVFSTRQVAIGADATASELSLTLAECASNVVREDLARAVDGELTAAPQDDARATHARLLSKSDGVIDWTRPASRVHDHVRGMSPWPGAFTYVGEGAARRLLKILTTARAEGGAHAQPGTIEEAHKDRIIVACGEGRIAIARAQLEGKKSLSAGDLVSGRALAEGQRLGSQT